MKMTWVTQAWGYHGLSWPRAVLHRSLALVSAAASVHGSKSNGRMGDVANILVVSDLHFGEELLPGASEERREAVEIGVAAFRDFVRYHAVRRVDHRPWRLVIAGDLFDFMSVVIAGSPELPAKTHDERRFGLGRGVAAGVLRMRKICEVHRPLLSDLVRFAAAGHRVDIIVGNHDVELLAPEVVAELDRQLAAAGADARTAPRIRVVPWFVYEPGVAWIEHGHVYDEGCSFEFNLAPTDPHDGRLIYNADYAAIRYLGAAVPEIDPHGIEEWGFWGYLRYAWEQGIRSFGRLVAAYARFAWALFAARAMHQSIKRRDRRRREHRARLAEAAAAGGITLDTAQSIDRLSRAPLTVSWRRLGRMVMLDRWGLIAGTLVAFVLMLILLPIGWALAGTAIAVVLAAGIQRWLGKHLVTSQLPMRAVPQRIKKLVDAPVVVFGHTHDPRWQPLRGGGVYVNSGTWLPATRPGLRRSFTHVTIQPREHALPLVELRQWRDGGSQPFDAGADIGAGVTTLPGVRRDELERAG
jgi:UDP-2,3-diacylglucosamine pyrophosphatase LpxH